MRIVTIGLGLSILGGTAAFAAEGNPISGVGVSVETSPGGIVTTYDNETEARTACTDAGGSWSGSEGKITCKDPRTPLAGRKGRGIAVVRGGGSFGAVQPGPVATPTATATLSGSEKAAAKPN
jgi:ABC-type nitrate/sulfonate/bicarbonate transport system substrate-binding protein